MAKFQYRPEVLGDLPEELRSHLKKYDDMFVLHLEDMKKIIDHFVKELEKGLSIEGGSIVSPHISFASSKSNEMPCGDHIADECNLGYGIPKRT